MSMDKNSLRECRYGSNLHKRNSSKKNIKVDLSNQTFIKDKERINKMIQNMDRICQKSEVHSEIFRDVELKSNHKSKWSQLSATNEIP